jgi:hypothetical protein
MIQTKRNKKNKIRDVYSRQLIDAPPDVTLFEVSLSKYQAFYAN